MLTDDDHDNTSLVVNCVDDTTVGFVISWFFHQFYATKSAVKNHRCQLYLFFVQFDAMCKILHFVQIGKHHVQQSTLQLKTIERNISDHSKKNGENFAQSVHFVSVLIPSLTDLP